MPCRSSPTLCDWKGGGTMARKKNHAWEGPRNIVNRLWWLMHGKPPRDTWRRICREMMMD